MHRKYRNNVKVDLEKLIEIQEKLSRKVSLRDKFQKRKIAGVDIAYKGDIAFCGAVILDYNTLEIIEERVVKSTVDFPYVPTLLAFREVKPILKVVKRLKSFPDILVIDGQGIAHPRGLGIASHIGVLLDLATIGVAKRLLCGKVEGKIELRKPQPILFNDAKVGYALKTKKNTSPIYISPGHKVSTESSVDIVLHCLKKHKLPEPTRLAHELATKGRG